MLTISTSEVSRKLHIYIATLLTTKNNHVNTRMNNVILFYFEFKLN